MAERAAHAINHEDDHQHQHQHHRHSDDEGLFGDEDPNNHYMHIVPSGGATPMRPPYATYIVQIPKDQIYRVPPPENAEFVQRYRNPVQSNQQAASGLRRRCAYWFLSIFFGLAFLITVIVCVHKFTLTPKPPSFSIKHLLVNQKSTGFQVSMETSNPNKVNDLGYKQGSVSLMYKEKQIGKGAFPALENQAPGISDPVDVTLSSKAALPKDLVSTNTKKGNKLVNMSLSMQIPVEMKTWLSSKTVDFSVTCDFEAESVGDRLNIQSEKCEVHK